MIVERNFRRDVKDTRVRRGLEIYSDLLLVLSKVEIRNYEANKRITTEQNNKIVEVIRTYKKTIRSKII